MSKKFLNVTTIVALMLSAIACNEDDPAVDKVNVDPISYLSENMVYVEGGTFLMGAQSSSSSQPNYESEAYEWESPVHQVTLSSYYIGKYEVTQALWEYVMNYSGKATNGTAMSAVGGGPWLGDSPISFRGLGNSYPAYSVSYNDIVNYFLPRLNQITGKSYRLPTEAEWEYAARGGQKDEYTRTQGASGTYYKYAGSNTINDVAWYSSNSNSTTHPVGSKSPNALGLYDMSGNVWEWCSDRFSYYSSNSVGDERICRGGYWYSRSVGCRVSNRGGNNPWDHDGSIGFRLAHSL